jgi:hypothetical protein
MQNYIFYFEDNTYLVFSLTPQEFQRVKEVFLTAKTHIILDNTIISKQNVRYVTEHKEQPLPESAVPDYMEQAEYEYLKALRRGEIDGASEEGNGY